MHRLNPRVVALLLLACAFVVERPAAVASPKRPPVLVTIVIDQLAAWIVDERLPLLPPAGGFARLAREGLRVREMRYLHALTETLPDHASLYTGALPRVHGVLADELPWIPACHPGAPPQDAPLDSYLLDPGAKPLPARAGAPLCAPSLSSLRVETLADVLRARRPDAVIVSLSLKDRGAIFAGGRRPDASLWMAPTGALVSSTAVARAVPPWVAPLVEAELRSLGAGRTWDLAAPAWVHAHAGTPDAQPGEGADFAADAAHGHPGLGATFPHTAWTPRALRATPFGDEYLLRAARAALDALPPAHGPVLLALSLSSNDGIGHVFGPDSFEAWDELYRLDAALAALFADLDRRFGDGGWSAILTADHGAPHLPEACVHAAVDRWERPCARDGRRLMPDPPPSPPTAPSATSVELFDLLQSAAARLPGGRRDHVHAIAGSFVFFSDEARQEPVRSVLARTLLALSIPSVRRLYDVRALPSECPPLPDESEAALVCRAVAPGSPSGDLFLVPEPGSFIDASYVRGHGVSHGSPHLYDRAVPLFVRAPGRILPGFVDGPIPFSAFTRTAAALLGVPPPSATLPAPDLLRPAKPPARHGR